MLKETTLWLPDGYGARTIIYDLEKNPYEATGKEVGGSNIYKVVLVEKGYAIEKIKQGALVIEGRK